MGRGPAPACCMVACDYKLWGYHVEEADMTTTGLLRKHWAIALLVAMAVVAPLVFAGCSGCQKEKPPAEVAKPAPPTPPPAAPKAPELVEVTPPAVTRPVLKLTPESATVTVALPPVSGLYDKALALAKRIAPPDFKLDAEVSSMVAEVAEDQGVPNAKSLAEIIRAKGFNPDAPAALFMDLTPMAQSAQAVLKAAGTAMPAPLPKEGAPKEGAPKEGASGASTGASGSAEAEEKSEAAPAPEAANPAPPISQETVTHALTEMKNPAVVGVVGCADPAVAEATVKEFLRSQNSPVDASKVEDINVDGVAVHSFESGKFAYAIQGNQLVLGNSLDMLKETLARFKTPAVIRYGTTECPPSAPDEVVTLTRLDKLGPLVKDLLPALLAANPGAAPLADTQKQAMDEYLAAFAGTDPLVTTINWTPDLIALLSRIDLSKHAALAEQMGENKPLRLAPLMPESTLLLFAQEFNAKTLETLKKTWTGGLPPGMPQAAGVEEAMGYVAQVIDVLGDELDLGIAGAEAGLPQVFMMAGLAKPEDARKLIEQHAPITPGETYKGVQIGSITPPVPVPVVVFIAFVDNTVIVSTDPDRVKALIDLLQSKGTSNLFGTLKPVLDVATPRQGLFILNTKLLTDVILPWTPANARFLLSRICGVVREVRMTKNEAKDHWAESGVTLYLNPPGPAAPAAGAPAPVAPPPEKPAASGDTPGTRSPYNAWGRGAKGPVTRIASTRRHEA